MAARESSLEAEQRRRRIYVRLRIPIARQELDAVIRETNTLVGQLASQPEQKPQELQQRVVYLKERRSVLRKELEELIEEQKVARHTRAEER